jgi:PBP1b-binding outer membrane lipoprotein LpoB
MRNDMKTWAIAAILGGTLLLAGCKQHREPPVENTPTEAPKPVVPPKPVAPAAVAEPKPAAPKAKPLPPTPEEQQVLDDADATGMTARVDRAGENNGAQAADTNREQ